MRKGMKQLTALLLTGVVSAGCLAGCGQAEVKKEENSETPSKTTQVASQDTAEAEGEFDWLNTDSTFPVVKEGTEKTLKIFVNQNAANGAPEDSWFCSYLVDKTNLNFEFTTFTDANRNEFLSLAFASGELPDIIIGANFTTSELIKYGATNGQIIDIAPYVNETYMPNLSAIYEEHPEYMDAVRDAEGRIWSVGFISNADERGYIQRVLMNYDWLDQCGLEVPTTLDDFLDAMRAFKEAGLAEYPVGGSKALDDPGNYILNALGYVGADSTADNICLRNGKVVLPYADREAFGEYLKVMNQMYTEGLIHPDFYTMDAVTTKAYLAEGVGFLNNAPYQYMPNTYNEFWAALPLTSSVNDTATWYRRDAVNYGKVVITSACEEPEMAANFLDCFYSMDEYLYRLAWSGPKSLLVKDIDETTDPIADILYGEEVTKNEKGSWFYKKYNDNPNAYSNETDYLYKHINIWGTSILGVDGWAFDPGNPYMYVGESDWSTFTDQDELRAAVAALNDGTKSFRVAVQVELTPYLAAEEYPKAVYLDESTTNELMNLATAMNEYAEQEIAKFVTGARALTDKELDDYFNTLDGLGASRYVQVYADYYDAVR